MEGIPLRGIDIISALNNMLPSPAFWLSGELVSP